MATQIQLVLPLKADNDERGSDIDRIRCGLVPSLRKYCDPSFVRKLSIIVPESDLGFARDLEHGFKFPTEVISETALVPSVPHDVPRRGWYIQQLVKLAYAQSCATPFYLTLNADVFLLNRFGADLLRNGRAPAHCEPASNHKGWWIQSAEIAEEIRNAFHYNLGKAFGVTPAFLATDVVRGLIDRLTYLADARRCADWIDFLCQRTTNDDDTWTENSLYWTYLINNVPDVDKIYYEHPIYHFAHSPQGIPSADAAHRTEYFGVLQSAFVNVTDFTEAIPGLISSGEQPNFGAAPAEAPPVARREFMQHRPRPAFDRYRAQGFEDVFGWCSAGLLTFLELVDEMHLSMGISGSVGEIGVQDGKLFIALHNLLRDGERSLAIDVFDDHHLNIDGSGDSKFSVFQQNLQRYAENPQLCTSMKTDSMDLGPVETQQILAQFGKFRLFSIDGSHTLDHTINDFLFAEKILRNGGIVLVDDYYNPYWPEVHQAIGYLYSQHRSKLAPMFYQCGKMFFTTAAYAAHYQKAICDHFRERDPNEPIKVCNFYGHQIVLLDNYKY